MSLARAFTKHSKKRVEDNDASFPRSCQVKYTPGTISRSKISLPTELLSTTNVHALNAPDIRKVSSTSSSSSVRSGGSSDQDFSTIDKGFLTLDNISIGSSPITPITPMSDDARDFFGSKPILAEPAAPAIPQRAPSHSKRAHVELSRKRSVQRMSPPPTEITNKPTKVHDLFSSQNSAPANPFERELAQVSEMAEEFGGGRALIDDEEQEMMSKGLCKFSASDYLYEIAPSNGGIFEDQLGFGLNPWM